MVLWPITRISCNSATESSSALRSKTMRSRLGSATTRSIFTIDVAMGFWYTSIYHDTSIQGELNGFLNPRICRIQSCRSLPGRLGPQGDFDCRARDAGPHGHPQQVRGREASQGRSDYRLAAHDDSDGGADRDAGLAGSRSSVG